MSEIRYCISPDDTTIGYVYHDGSEPPVVVVAHSLMPAESQFLATFAVRGRGTLYFDRRGVGYSQREVSDITDAKQLSDLESVLEHARIVEFDLVGLGDGCAVAATYAAVHPHGILRLALVYPLALGDKPDGLSTLIRANWGLGRRAVVDFFSGRLTPEERRERLDVLRRTVAPEVAAQYVDLAFDWHPGRELGSIASPTLVVPSDLPGSVDRARSLTALISDTRLVIVKGAPHAVLREFLEGDELASAEMPLVADSAVSLRTVLFTDLVGHTQMMSRLGDERGRAVLREHERITREVLKAHGGTEVKTMGDGFMASFGSVTKAVECAVALQREIGDWKSEIGERIEVRCGLNAGEPIEEDGDLFGATVILASRIATKAEGGEILVADTVRGLCSGKGFLFADRGEFVAKGFEEPVRVYEVRWQEDVKSP